MTTGIVESKPVLAFVRMTTREMERFPNVFITQQRLPRTLPQDICIDFAHTKNDEYIIIEL